MERRRCAPAEKLEILLEGLRDGNQMATGVSSSRILREKKLLGSAGAVFGRKEDKKDRQMERLQEELCRKDRVIAEITAKNLDLKKRIGYRGSSPGCGGAAVGHRGRSGADKKEKWFKGKRILAALGVGRSAYYTWWNETQEDTPGQCAARRANCYSLLPGERGVWLYFGGMGILPM
jgi:hypothetical protein